MKLLTLITIVAFGQLAMAHYECTGVCKYTYYDILKASVVSGSADSHSGAISNMRNACSDNCYGDHIKGCSVVDSSCATPDRRDVQDETKFE